MGAVVPGMVLMAVLGTAEARADLEDCFAEAARRYNIAGELLYAIAAHESRFDPTAVGLNRDGTRDIGVMQINSWWLPRLAEYGIEERHLFEPCTNVSVGAWILAANFGRYGYTWDAVGAYNAGTAESERIRQRREDYAHKVAAQLGLYRHTRGMRDASVRAR